MQQTTRRRLIISIILFLLLLPIIGMCISDQVHWSLADFIIAGALLSGAGLTIEHIFMRLKSRRSKTLACIVLFFIFALIWGELAVGLFGTPWAGN